MHCLPLLVYNHSCARNISARLLIDKPLSVQDPLVFAGRELEIQFRMSKPLTDFMATLHKNGVEEKRLSKYISHTIVDDFITFLIGFPEEGQYGLDVYTREISSSSHKSDENNHHHHHHNHKHTNGSVNGEKHLLTHCCKYLINSSKRN